MKKTILITGSTDGIGFLTAQSLLLEGHDILIHGRDPKKIQQVKEILSKHANRGSITSYISDFSDLHDVKELAQQIEANHQKLDVLINNAGIYKTSIENTKDNLDIRFTVNTIAPYLLTKELLPLFDNSSRIINLSSAAQASVNLNALQGNITLSSSEAYAQSKLAITMWTNVLALKYTNQIGTIVSINPASLLGTKMVKEAYGMEGKDLTIGVNILLKATLSSEFESASGKYYDNDIERFTSPHPDALDIERCTQLVNEIDIILKNKLDN